MLNFNGLKMGNYYFSWCGRCVVFTHWSSINFFTVCVSEAVAHVELVEFGLKSNLKFYNFGQVESYV